MSKVMKAVRLHAFGGPDELHYEDATMPVPVAGEVLVRVYAAGINPPDLYLREGYRTLPPEWQPSPQFPLIPGTDVSGVVMAVHDDDTGFRVGDEVYAMIRFPDNLFTGSGGYAEYVTVPAKQLVLKPRNINHMQAAAAPMSLLTAWQFLVETGHDAPNPFQSFPHVPVALKGKTVLVNGAGGGVGHLAVQIACWKGAHVIAVASGRHESLLRELGAETFMDYKKVAPEAHVKNIDLVIDTVGGNDMARFLRAIRPGGALYPVNPLGFTDYDEAARLGVTVSSIQVRSSGKQLNDAAVLLEDGTLRLVVENTWPLYEAAKAHERASRGSIQGKLVLTVA